MSLDHVGKCRTGGGAQFGRLAIQINGRVRKWVAASCEPRTFELEQRRLDLSELRTANGELFNLGR